MAGAAYFTTPDADDGWGHDPVTIRGKFWLVYVVIAGLLVFAIVKLRGAQGPTIVAAPQLVSLEAIPLYDGDVLKSLHVTAKFRMMVLGPDGGPAQPVLRPVDFDLITSGEQSVVVDGEMSTYREIATDLIGVAKYNLKLAFPDPLPVNRRALRERAAAGRE